MSTRRIEVLNTPADFETLRKRDLSDSACVVFDVLRATSSMVVALANGAWSVRPVAEVAEAVKAHTADPQALLAGERDGVRITADVSGGVEFHLGNSPREFTAERVAGRRIISTTTNGTRALRACEGAATVLVSCFLNAGATIAELRRTLPANLFLVCGGTYEEAAYEDLLAAGAFVGALWPEYRAGHVADSAMAAMRLHAMEAPDVFEGLSRSRNGRRLLSRPDLAADVAFCAQVDSYPVLARMNAMGIVTRAL